MLNKTIIGLSDLYIFLDLLQKCIVKISKNAYRFNCCSIILLYSRLVEYTPIHLIKLNIRVNIIMHEFTSLYLFYVFILLIKTFWYIICIVQYCKRTYISTCNTNPEVNSIVYQDKVALNTRVLLYYDGGS